MLRNIKLHLWQETKNDIYSYQVHSVLTPSLLDRPKLAPLLFYSVLHQTIKFYSVKMPDDFTQQGKASGTPHYFYDITYNKRQ